MITNAMSSYNEFVRKYSGKFKPEISKEKLDLAAIELSELLSSVSTQEKPYENPAYLYDSLSNMKTLAAKASKSGLLEKSAEFGPQSVTEMSADLNKAMEEVGKETTLDDANSRLLDYFEISSFPRLLTKLCDKVNQNFELSPDELADKTKPVTDEMEKLFDSAADKFKGVGTFFGSIGNEIKNAIRELAVKIKEKVGPKIKEIMEKITDLYFKFQWKLMEPSLKFANTIIDLAKKNNWNIKEVHVSTPEWNSTTVNLLNVNIPIPIPNVKSKIVFTHI